jgi:Asp-tRNA(Asn)/Glu-tRNA(Gln) amidotransferase B subunit
MPEPNLPPLRVLLDDCHSVPDSDSHHVNVGYLKRTLPELPRETRENLTNRYRISQESAVILVVSISKDISNYSVI